MITRMLSDFSPLLHLHDQVNHMLETFFEDLPTVREYAPAYPPLCVYETSDGGCGIVEAELPGLTIADVNVELMGRQLTISGQRRIGSQDGQSPTQGIRWHRRERAQGQFSRTITLPWEVQADQIQATLRDGVLTVTLPRSESSRPKRVKLLSA